MSTQAASTRPMNRPAQDVQNRAAMQEAPTRQMPMMHDGHREPMPAPGTETKQAFLTTEFWIYAAAVTTVVIAAFWRGTSAYGLNLNNPGQAWFFITLLTLGYLGSRGLAKAGSAKRSGEERKRGR
ncbi:hypothetical protein ACN26Z_10205 [Verrucosispora sp. WMMD703]|uniref:Uncharacterized protein n=1 Tax=Micromonospora sediminimaris TaxID=547162 RepID=A0A9W5UX16_9ACTN|nr:MULTISPECIES: hypothetical protein [Micromonospora]WFE44178.1 hypothetical protein O7624_07435 [Verrucosispora sp. WMMD1129]GIJ36205.1 hypothetical protein Vse01_53530 [Micromonospora sediminimaris]SFC51917.1 hypothetical protein SAMN05216284_10593 [Micromonospora sediminimaris]